MIKAVSIAAAVVASAYLGWQASFPSTSFRYRLSLEVETPEGLKTGSSVVEITETKQPKLGDAPSGVMKVRGEAVVVDLGTRGLLLALLKGVSPDSDPGNIVYSTLPPATPYGSGAASLDNLRRYARSSEKTELPLSRISLLVRFRDSADPNTVERLAPDNLGASIGPGVRLSRATLELTRDALTRELENRITWTRRNSHLEQFWRRLYQSGYRPSGTVDARSFFLVGQ